MRSDEDTPVSAEESNIIKNASRLVRVAELALLLAVYVLAITLFFRSWIFSGFDLGFGDRADGIIEIAILEHWRNVFTGAADWHTTGYFFPYRGTLGYNDGYFLYGVIYSFWRLFADPFQSDLLNILTFKTIGFFSAYALVSRTLGWGRSAALMVATLWTISASLSLQAVHAQLQSVALLPVAMILGISAVRAEQTGRYRRARLSGLALAALMAAWLMTSYYMAWFTIFSGGLYLLCWAAITDNWRPAALLKISRRHFGTLACTGIAFAILIIPFLSVYLPKARETGGQSYHQVLRYLVTPLVDMINVGSGNYLWGWIFRALQAGLHAISPRDPAMPERVFGGEHVSGMPLALFVLVVTAAWRLIVRRRDGEDRAVSFELRAFALAMILAWALTLQFWKASPWALVFQFVPGAKGMRVVSRYQLWLALPFLLIVVAAWRAPAIRLAKSFPWLAAMVGIVLVIENLSAHSAAQLSRSVQRGALSTVPPPPADCDSFYVVAARRDEPLYVDVGRNAVYPHNVDAMLLAELWRVPTINGFSTFNPPDWNFADPLAGDYDARISRYVRRHDLRNVCRLDVRDATPWRSPIARR